MIATLTLDTSTRRIRLTGRAWADLHIADRVIVETRDEIAVGIIAVGTDLRPVVELIATIGPGHCTVRWPRQEAA